MGKTNNPFQPNLERPSWDTYFLELATMVKNRSNCIRLQVGVVIVKDVHIIATGYNGTPRGIPNCSDGGCERCMHREQNILKENERKDLCVCVHAEQNAIFQSAYHGVSTKGAVLYTTLAPCLHCARAIINSGIVKVVYGSDFDDVRGINLLSQAGVAVNKHAAT